MLIGGAVLCVSSITSVVTCVLLVHWLSLLGYVASFFYGVMVHVSGKRLLSAQKLLDTLIFTSYQLITLWYLSCYGLCRWCSTC